MTAQTTDSIPVSRATAAPAQPLPHEVDYSGRIPLLILITCSLLWLAFSLFTGVFASVKMHAPGMLANVGALTYGRVAAVSSSTFLYGFAIQAGIACALWLFARLGKSYLMLPSGTIIAALAWNIVLLIGVIEVFGGNMNQFPTLQLPYWTATAFFVIFIVLGLSGLLTYIARTERDSYPSTWFLFAAFFSFAWVLTAAWLLLGYYPVCGIFQPIIATWYANSLINLVLAPIALALVFYFVSKLSQEPLYSYSLAATGFWFYILFAPATGFQNLAAVPNWMPSLSAVVNLILLLPAISFGINWYRTCSRAPKTNKNVDPAGKYMKFAAFAFLLGAFLITLISCPVVDTVVGLTLFIPGVSQWILYGFIAMAFFAGIMHIAPRLTETDWPSLKLGSVHYWLTVIGLVVLVLGLLIGGVVQGQAINNPAVAPVQISKKVVPFIGVSTLGLLLLLIGQLALLINLFSMFKNACCCILPMKKEAAR